MHPIKLLLFISLVILSSTGKSQNSSDEGIPFTQNYSPLDYSAESQNWTIAQDKRNVMYFGNTDGILEFDGSTWRIIKTANNTIARSLLCTKNGVIFAGAANDFGFLKPMKNGSLKFISLRNKIPANFLNFQDVWKIAESGEHIYFFSDNYIFDYNNDSINVLEMPMHPNVSMTIGNHLFVINLAGGILMLKDGKLIHLPQSEDFAPSTHGRIIVLPILENNKVLINTNYGGSWIYDMSALDENYQLKPDFKGVLKVKIKSNIEEYLTQKTIYAAIMLTNGDYAFGTIEGGLVITDKNLRLKSIIDRNKGLGGNSVYDIYEDVHNYLWVASEFGISRIDLNNAITRFDQNNGLEATVLYSYNHNGTRYVGTMQRLFYLQSGNKKNELSQKFRPVRKMYLEVWSITSLNNKVYAFTSYGVVPVNDTIAGKHQSFGNVYCTAKSPKFPNNIFVGTTDGISVLEASSKAPDGYDFIIHKPVKEINEAVTDMSVDTAGNLWLSTYYNGIYRFKPTNLQATAYELNRFDTAQGLPQMDQNFTLWFDGKLLIATQKGIYRAIGSFPNLRFEHDERFFDAVNKDSVPITLLRVKGKRLWYDSPTAVGFFEMGKNGQFERNESEFRQIPRFALHNIFPEDSLVWFATSTGLFRYSEKKGTHTNRNYPTLLRRVKLGADSVIFDGCFSDKSAQNEQVFPMLEQSAGAKLIIDYKHNSISFEFSAAQYELTEHNEYKSRLIGYEESWTDWNRRNERTFTNLNAGVYVFEVVSRNVYGEEGMPTRFKFKIKPPWYGTILAYVLYGVLLGLIIYLAVWINLRRLKLQNLKLERIIYERTTEIERQNLEIKNQASVLEEANKELEKLSEVASHTDNAVIIMSRNADFLWINDAFSRMYGYTYDECINGHKINLQDYTAHPAALEFVKRVVNEKISVRYEFLSRRQDGSRFWAQTTLSPILDSNNQVRQVIAIDTDISKIKSAEAEIMQQKEEIESQRDELQRVNAMKDKFFAIIAHDLRGPLGTVISSTGLIYENYDFFTEEEKHAMIGEVHNASYKTFNLLENLLHWSRSQRGELRYRPEKVDLCLLVDENIELVRINANNKGIKVEYQKPDGEITALADENMFSTVLRNLLANAIKFTKEKGTISVNVFVRETDVLISVKDNGIGIAPADKEKLFRIDTHHTTLGTSKEKGTGLGLILCKELVEKNNGTIWVDSVEGKGSTFSFTVPLA